MSFPAKEIDFFPQAGITKMEEFQGGRGWEALPDWGNDVVSENVQSEYVVATQ
jgi:hypothetical protein